MKRIICWLLVVLMIFCISSALAQRISCPDGGFSLKLPDRFYELPLGGDPELCLQWSDGEMTVQAYVSYQGEIAGSDLFQVLDGSETDFGTKKYNGMEMLYARTEDGSDICLMYSWMDRGNNVTLYFYFPDGGSSGTDTVKSIMKSISFDAGH